MFSQNSRRRIKPFKKGDRDILNKLNEVIRVFNALNAIRVVSGASDQMIISDANSILQTRR